MSNLELIREVVACRLGNTDQSTIAEHDYTSEIAMAIRVGTTIHQVCLFASDYENNAGTVADRFVTEFSKLIDAAREVA